MRVTWDRLPALVASLLTEHPCSSTERFAALRDSYGVLHRNTSHTDLESELLWLTLEELAGAVGCGTCGFEDNSLLAPIEKRVLPIALVQDPWVRDAARLNDPHQSAQRLGPLELQTYLLEEELDTAEDPLLDSLLEQLRSARTGLSHYLRSEPSRAMMTQVALDATRSEPGLPHPVATAAELEERYLTFGDSFLRDRWLYGLLRGFIECFTVAEAAPGGHVLLKLPVAVLEHIRSSLDLGEENFSDPLVEDTAEVLETAVRLYNPSGAEGSFHSLSSCLQAARALARET